VEQQKTARHFCLTASLILASHLIKLALDSWMILDFLFMLYRTALMAIGTTAFFDHSIKDFSCIAKDH
jgi:hypothetical protein